MKLINDILCLEYGEYVADTIPLTCGINKNTYDQQKKRGNISVLKSEGEGNKAFIVISSLPKKYYQKVLEVFGEPEEYYKKQQEEARKANRISVPEMYAPFLAPQDELYFVREYNVNGGRANGRNRAHELMIACAILRLLNTYSTLSKVRENTGYNSKAELQDAICAYIKDYGDDGLYGLPASYRRLQPKVKGWRELEKGGDDPRAVFNLERFDKNATRALKFTMEHQAVFFSYYLNPRADVALGKKLPLDLCHRNYVHVMQHEFGIDPDSCPTPAAIRAHINKSRFMQNMVSLSRNGTTYFDSHVMPYMLGKAPEYNLSLVAGDGWVPGRSVRTVRKVWDQSAQQYVLRERIKRVSVWIWYDWKSKAIISWHVSETETGEAIRKSFRDIISFWGKVPGSVMIDKSWMRNGDTARLFERAGVCMESKPPYSPQTSIAERNNKEMNKYFRAEDPFWINMDINTHTVNFRHDEDWVKQSKPIDEVDFYAALDQMIKRYNNTPLKSLNGRSPIEDVQMNVHPDLRSVDYLEANFIFGDRRGPVSVVRGVFKIEIGTKTYAYKIGFELKTNKNGEKLAYVNDDYTLFERTVRPSEKILVYYDEKHMDTVDVYTYMDEEDPVTHKYLLTAVSSDFIAVNRSSFEDNKQHNLGQQRTQKQRVKQHYSDELQKYAAQAEYWGINSETLQQHSQQREKELQADNVDESLRKYHKDRVIAEMPVGVTPKNSPKKVNKKKQTALEKRMQQFQQPS